MLLKPSLKAYQFNPEVKAIGQLTPYQKRVYANLLERIRGKHQRSMRRNLRTCFKAQCEAILDLEDPSLQDINRALLSKNPLLEQTFEYTYASIADDIYPMVEKTTKVKALWEGLEKKSVDTDLFYRAQILQWIQNNCAIKISEINETTILQIQRLYASTSNMIEFRDSVQDLFAGSIEPYRANAIARTETASATNRASLETVKSTGFEGWKIWNTISDMDTRDTHAALNGKKVGRDELFSWFGKYGYVQMECPGDGTHGAPAGEIVNCRCYLTYELDI